MRVTYDEGARAYYAYLSEAQVIRTNHVHNDVLFDIDVEGNVVGIEILEADFLDAAGIEQF